MAEKDKKCPGRKGLQGPCGRELYDDTNCIFHSEDPNKDTELFQIELNKILEEDSTKVHDFTGFIFPKGIDFTFNIGKKILFRNAIFRGTAYFIGSTFQNPAIFEGAIFQSKVDFTKVIFKDEVVFERTTFKNEVLFRKSTFEKQISFEGANFEGETSFTQATFGGKADFWNAIFQKDVSFTKAIFKNNSKFVDVTSSGKVVFNAATFEDALIIDQESRNGVFSSTEVDFRSVRFLKPELVRFRKVDLSKFRFLNTNLRKVEFVNVDWDKKRWKRGVKRIYRGVNRIYDEISPDPETNGFNYPLISQVYKRLRANYEENLNYAEAGDFHIGEMECKRKGYKTRVGRNLCLTAFYKYVSNYGEGYRRTFYLWILPMLILFPLLFMYSGIEPVTPSQSSHVIDYDFHGSLISVNKVGDWAKDYWKSSVYSLSVFSLVREKQYRPIDNWGHFWMVLESILSPVLIALFLLALRRRFRR